MVHLYYSVHVPYIWRKFSLFGNAALGYLLGVQWFYIDHMPTIFSYFSRFQGLFTGWRWIWLCKIDTFEGHQGSAKKFEVCMHFITSFFHSICYFAIIWCMCWRLLFLPYDRDYLKSYARAKYFEDAKPWNERCDLAFPCASQNEIDQSDALSLVTSGCRILIEGCNPDPSMWSCVGFFPLFFS